MERLREFWKVWDEPTTKGAAFAWYVFGVFVGLAAGYFA